MSYLYPDTALIVFAREPIPGQVKTRLIPTLGAAAACDLYRRLLDHTLTTAINSQLARLYLYITPESNPGFFLQHKQAQRYKVKIQQGGDLGERMYNALESTLLKYSRAILIGTDCPFITRTDLEDALLSLTGSTTMVYAPAEDGGYVLIGAKALIKSVFLEVDWGSAQVMEQSRKNMFSHSIKWRELRTLQDIDTEADLAAIRELEL